MITTRRAARVALTITLAGTLGLAACGDDDPDDAAAGGGGSEQAADEGAAAGSSSAAGDNAEFCEAFLALDRGFAAAPEDPAEVEAFAADVVTPNVATLRESAPDAVGEDVLVMADAAETFASSGDFAALETPEFSEASGNVYPELGALCGLQQVDVTAVDYGFEGVPDTLEAGDTVFTLTNDSEAGEHHEMAIMKLRDGVDLALDELLALSEQEAQEYLEPSPVGTFAPAGAVSGTTTELTPGRYVYVCFVPVGTVGDTEGTGPPHFMEGMAGEFAVE